MIRFRPQPESTPDSRSINIWRTVPKRFASWQPNQILTNSEPR